MSQLVLSLFPGIDLFGAAFKESGFSVVQGGDVIYAVPFAMGRAIAKAVLEATEAKS